MPIEFVDCSDPYIEHQLSGWFVSPQGIFYEVCEVCGMYARLEHRTSFLRGVEVTLPSFSIVRQPRDLRPLTAVDEGTQATMLFVLSEYVEQVLGTAHAITHEESPNVVSFGLSKDKRLREV